MSSVQLFAVRVDELPARSVIHLLSSESDVRLVHLLIRSDDDKLYAANVQNLTWAPDPANVGEFVARSGVSTPGLPDMIQIESETLTDGTSHACTYEPAGVHGLGTYEQIRGVTDFAAASYLRDDPLPPGCRRPLQEASVTAPVAPDYPDSAMRQRAQGVVLVSVRVGIDGKPLKVEVFKSSGTLALDNAALSAARISKYLPKFIYCKPVESTYLFRATFSTGPIMHRRS